MTHLEAKRLLNGRSHLVIAPNTTLHRTSQLDISLRYYETDLICFKGYGVMIVFGGSRSKTNKDRLNQYIPEQHQGIYQDKGDWFWKDGKPFKDGTILFEKDNTRRVKQKNPKRKFDILTIST